MLVYVTLESSFGDELFAFEPGFELTELPNDELSAFAPESEPDFELLACEELSGFGPEFELSELSDGDSGSGVEVGQYEVYTVVVPSTGVVI